MKKKPIPEDCMPACRTCVFFEKSGEIPGGICRRYPPKIAGNEEGFMSEFPIIEINDWCGEYLRATH